MLAFGTACRSGHYRSIMFGKGVDFSEARNFREDTCQPVQCGSSETYTWRECGERANARRWLATTFVFTTAELRGGHEFQLMWPRVWSLSCSWSLAFHSAPGAAYVDLQSELRRRGEHGSGPDSHRRSVVIFRKGRGATMLVDVLAEAVS